jgi:hypothetical protein
MYLRQSLQSACHKSNGTQGANTILWGGLPHRDFLLVVNYRVPEERMKLNYNDLGTFLIFCVRKDFQWKFKMQEVIVKSGQVAGGRW